MIPRLDKTELVHAAVSELTLRLEGMTRRARAEAAGATHEESRSEDAKDTRAIEASYMARGQAKRVAEAEVDLQLLQTLTCRTFQNDSPISTSALVALQDAEGDEKLLFLAPAAGGLQLAFDGHVIQFTTPRSPLGRALMGKTEGDELEVQVGASSREYTVLGIG